MTITWSRRECKSTLRGVVGEKGDLLPNGDIDDDEEEQGEGGDPTADDERDGREQCLVHDLWRQGERHVDV